MDVLLDFLPELHTAAAALVLLLPVLIPSLRFPLACLAAIWLMINRIILIPGDSSLGGAIRAGWLAGGALCIGAAWGGSLVSIVLSITGFHTDAHLGLLCVVALLGLYPFCSARPYYSPPLMWVSALVGTIAFGLTVVLGQKQHTAVLVWTQVVRPVVLTSALAGAAGVGAALVLWPQLASRQVEQQVAKVMRGAAESLEKCGEALLTRKAGSSEGLGDGGARVAAGEQQDRQSVPHRSALSHSPPLVTVGSRRHSFHHQPGASFVGHAPHHHHLRVRSIRFGRAAAVHRLQSILDQHARAQAQAAADVAATTASATGHRLPATGAPSIGALSGSYSQALGAPSGAHHQPCAVHARHQGSLFGHGWLGRVTAAHRTNSASCPDLTALAASHERESGQGHQGNHLEQVAGLELHEQVEGVSDGRVAPAPSADLDVMQQMAVVRAAGASDPSSAAPAATSLDRAAAHAGDVTSNGTRALGALSEESADPAPPGPSAAHSPHNSRAADLAALSECTERGARGKIPALSHLSLGTASATKKGHHGRSTSELPHAVQRTSMFGRIFTRSTHDDVPSSSHASHLAGKRLHHSRTGSDLAAGASGTRSASRASLEYRELRAEIAEASQQLTKVEGMQGVVLMRAQGAHASLGAMDHKGASPAGLPAPPPQVHPSDTSHAPAGGLAVAMQAPGQPAASSGLLQSTATSVTAPAAAPTSPPHPGSLPLGAGAPDDSHGTGQRQQQQAGSGDVAVDTGSTYVTIIHEELEGDDFYEMLLAVTRPRLPRRRALITAAPPLPTELLPAWASLGLRMSLGAAAKTLAAAQAEPPGLLPLLVGLQSLGWQMWGGKQVPSRVRDSGHGGVGCGGWCYGGHSSSSGGNSGVVMCCVRCRWPAVLKVLGQLVDRLASLEAVVGDVASHLLADPASAALLAHDGAPPGQLEATVRHAVGSAARLLRTLAAQLDRRAEGARARDRPGAGPSLHGVGQEVSCKAGGAYTNLSKHNGPTQGVGGKGGVELAEVRVVQSEALNGTAMPTRTVGEEAAALQEAVIAASRAYWGRIIRWKRQHIAEPLRDVVTGEAGSVGMGHAPSARALVPQAMPIRLLRGRQMRAFFFAAMALEQALELTHALHELLSTPSTPFQPSPPRTTHKDGQTAATESGAPSPVADSVELNPDLKARSTGNAANATAPARAQMLTTSCEACSGPCWQLKAWLMWARPLLSWLLAESIWVHSVQCTRTGLHAVLRGMGGVRELLHVRDVQAGVKYLAACAIMLISTLIVQHFKANLLAGPPIFGYIATAAVMSEKVETTMSKMVLRVVFSTVGACVGAAFMASAKTANSPYIVAAVVCTAYAIASRLSTTAFKLAGLLAMSSLVAVISCQYLGCCGHTGSVNYFAERLVTVGIGCVLPVIIAQLVAPWYLSDWATSELAGSFVAAMQLLEQHYEELCAQLTDCAPGQPDALQLNRASATAAQGMATSPPPANGVGPLAFLPELLQQPTLPSPEHQGYVDAAIKTATASTAWPAQPGSRQASHTVQGVAAHGSGDPTLGLASPSSMRSGPGGSWTQAQGLWRMGAGGNGLEGGVPPVGGVAITMALPAAGHGHAGDAAQHGVGQVLRRLSWDWHMPWHRPGSGSDSDLHHQQGPQAHVQRPRRFSFGSHVPAPAIRQPTSHQQPHVHSNTHHNDHGWRSMGHGAHGLSHLAPPHIVGASTLVAIPAPGVQHPSASSVVGPAAARHPPRPPAAATQVSETESAVSARLMVSPFSHPNLQALEGAGTEVDSMTARLGSTRHPSKAPDDPLHIPSHVPRSSAASPGAVANTYAFVRGAAGMLSRGGSGAQSPTQGNTSPNSRRGSALPAAALVNIASRTATLVAAVSATLLPPAPTPAPVTLATVQRPLSLVQESVARDSALWQRGVLSTPPIVHALCAAVAHLVDRLTGLQIALAGARRLLAGRRGGTWVYVHFLSHLDTELRLNHKAALDMAVAAREVLKARPGSPQQAEANRALRRAIAQLVARRAETHAHIVALRAAAHARVMRTAERWARAAEGSAVGQQAVELPPLSPILQVTGSAGAAATPAAGATTPPHTYTLTEPAATAGPHDPAPATATGEGEEDWAMMAEYGRGGAAMYAADNVAWLACLHALAAVLDAAVQAARTVSECGEEDAQERSAAPSAWLK